MTKVHLPPMKKFACKLHGYIVYFFLGSEYGYADPKMNKFLPLWSVRPKRLCAISRQKFEEKVIMTSPLYGTDSPMKATESVCSR